MDGIPRRIGAKGGGGSVVKDGYTRTHTHVDSHHRKRLAHVICEKHDVLVVDYHHPEEGRS